MYTAGWESPCTVVQVVAAKDMEVAQDGEENHNVDTQHQGTRPPPPPSPTGSHWCNLSPTTKSLRSQRDLHLSSVSSE